MGKSKEEYQEEIKRFNDRLYGGNRGDRGNRLSDNPDYDRSKGRYGGLKSPGPKRPDWSRPGMSRLEKRDEKREWGKSRPGEMYIQIEGPGNPSWEARNPGRKPVDRPYNPPPIIDDRPKRSTRWQDRPLPNPSRNRPRSNPSQDYSFRETAKERDRREALERRRSVVTRPTRDLNRGMGQMPIEIPSPDDLGPVMDRIGPDKPVGPDTDRWGRPKGTVYFDRRHEDPDAWERRRRELEPPSPTEPRRPPKDWSYEKDGHPGFGIVDHETGKWGTGFVDDSGMGRGGRIPEPRRPLVSRPYRPPTRPTPTDFSQRLSSDEERIRLLTGESDPSINPYSTQFDGRSGRRTPGKEYDPQDRKFNNQFSESPRGRQPWESTLTNNPLERDPLEGYNVQEGRYNRTPPRPPERFTGRRRGRRNIKNRR